MYKIYLKIKFFNKNFRINKNKKKYIFSEKYNNLNTIIFLFDNA